MTSTTTDEQRRQAFCLCLMALPKRYLNALALEFCNHHDADKNSSEFLRKKLEDADSLSLRIGVANYLTKVLSDL